MAALIFRVINGNFNVTCVHFGLPLMVIRVSVLRCDLLHCFLCDCRASFFITFRKVKFCNCGTTPQSAIFGIFDTYFCVCLCVCAFTNVEMLQQCICVNGKIFSESKWIQWKYYIAFCRTKFSRNWFPFFGQQFCSNSFY